MEITVVVGFGHSAGHHARRTLGLAGDNMGLTYEGSPEADAQMKANGVLINHQLGLIVLDVLAIAAGTALLVAVLRRLDRMPNGPARSPD